MWAGGEEEGRRDIKSFMGRGGGGVQEVILVALKGWEIACTGAELEAGS